MTRKDYVLIADALASTPLPDRERDALVRSLSRALAQDNPRFDPSRFKEACSV